MAVLESGAALGMSPEELPGTSEDAVKPSLVHVAVSTGCPWQGNVQASGQP